MSELTSQLFRDDPAAYYAELGAKAERERIIKLLEDRAVLIESDKSQVISLIRRGQQK